MVEKISVDCVFHIDALLGNHLTILSQESLELREDKQNSGLPLVTIITPSFNQGSFLERTMLSVLNQDWPNIEYLIVDGGSTDNSVAIIEKYKDRLAWWVSEQDSGQTEAINKGVRRAHGKYVTWLGSDDVLLPGAIRTMVEALEENPSAGMVYGSVVFIDGMDRVIKANSYTDMTLDKLLYHKHSTIAQPSSLLRNETLHRAGLLDESLSYCMDYDLWIRLHKVAPSINLGDTVLSGYRLHADSKTVGSYRKMALEKIRVNRKYTNDIINKVIYSHYWYIIEGAIKALWRG